jgi:hypothetical protein
VHDQKIEGILCFLESEGNNRRRQYCCRIGEELLDP